MKNKYELKNNNLVKKCVYIMTKKSIFKFFYNSKKILDIIFLKNAHKYYLIK